MLDGQEPRDDQALLDDALELVIDQVDLVGGSGREVVDDLARDLLGGVEDERREGSDVLRTQGSLAPPEEVARLASHGNEPDLTLALLGDEACRRSDEVGVEATTQALVRRHQDDENPRVPPLGEEGVDPGVAPGGCRVEDFQQLPSERDARRRRLPVRGAAWRPRPSSWRE